MYPIDEHNKLELILLKLSGRTKPENGTARYSEMILGVKYVISQLNANGVDVKSYSHGGARKGEEFNADQEHNIYVLLSEKKKI